MNSRSEDARLRSSAKFVDGLQLKGNLPRVVQIGSDFGRYFPLYGLSTLIHEAKHSDCSEEIDAATLSKWSALKDLKELAAALANHSCGYSHSLCPQGSAMAGRMSCDSSIGGPYTVQYAFNRAVVRFCANCTFPERALMQLFALDAASRIPLPEPIAATIARTVDRLPKLQKEFQAKDLVENILESVLKPVDEALNDDPKQPMS